ncbi:MAG: NAD(P)-dependent glycerol-1-phosphate dehydrogenase [Candidatus Hadarchaeales archaeon]
MRDIHTIDLPTRVVVGRKVIEKVGETCRELGLRGRVLVLSGPHTQTRAGRRVITSLEEEGFEPNLLRVEGEPLEEVEEEIRRTRPSFLVGVGGGRVIDLAKYSSSRARLPFLSVPTAASHDGIASSRASLRRLGPLSVDARTPLAILADVEVISRSPHRLTASGCGDLMAKFTAVRDWRLSHLLTGEYYGDYSAQLALMSAEVTARNSKLIGEGKEEGVRVVVEALISCGVAMCIAGSSRPCSGSEHSFAHALEEVSPNPSLHGERCGVGTILMAYLHGMNWKRVRRVLSEVGAPTTAEELGVEGEAVVEAMLRAREIRPERFTILNRKKLNKEMARRIAEKTGVV